MLSMPRIVRPDPQRFRARNLVPRWTAYSAGPLSETKNWSKHLIESIYSQTRRG